MLRKLFILFLCVMIMLVGIGSDHHGTYHINGGTVEAQGLVEYALVLVLVAVIVIAILTLLGPQIGAQFGETSDEFYMNALDELKGGCVGPRCQKVLEMVKNHKDYPQLAMIPNGTELALTTAIYAGAVDAGSVSKGDVPAPVVPFVDKVLPDLNTCHATCNTLDEWQGGWCDAPARTDAEKNSATCKGDETIIVSESTCTNGEGDDCPDTKKKDKNKKEEAPVID